VRGIILINIFDTKAQTKVSKRQPKSHRSNSPRTGEKKLSKVNPMAFGILAVKVQENPNNDFLKSSFKAISEAPHMLTDKWIASINKFVASIVEAVLLDPPECAEGERVSLSNLVVSKIVAPKEYAEYPVPAIIAVDDRGWKFYFKTSKAYSFRAGDIISFVGTVSSHKDGITFMRRPSKITKLEEQTKVDDSDK
jgi:hypothetical protein